MCNIFGGDDFPDPPHLPAPPPLQDIMEVIDEINGVKLKPINDIHGKQKGVSLRRLPRTPQEEALFQAGTDLMKKALSNIKVLYQNDPRSVVDYAPLINVFANLDQKRQQDLAEVANFTDIAQQVQDYKTMNERVLEENIQRQQNAMEERLSHLGISDSTAATEYRNSLAKENDLLRLQGKVNADIYGEGLADQKLARAAKAFGMRELSREKEGQSALMGYELAQRKEQNLEGKRAENINLLGAGAGVRGEDLNKAQGSPAAALGQNLYSIGNNAQFNRYNADINRLNADYQNQVLAYQARPNFGDSLLQLGGMAAGKFIGGMF